MFDIFPKEPVQRSSRQPSRFIVTGCGRSGTTYVARVLDAAGCSCGHEKFFPRVVRVGPFFYDPARRRRLSWRAAWPTPPLGESAWQAAPHIPRLPAGTVVFHQVREPMAFIRSRLKKGLTYYDLRRRYCPIPGEPSSRTGYDAWPVERQVEYLAEFWFRWNLLVERAGKVRRLAYYRYRLETVDLDHFDAMLDAIGADCDRERLKFVFGETRTDMHSRGDTDLKTGWNMLPRAVAERVGRKAREYGYSETSGRK